MLTIIDTCEEVDHVDKDSADGTHRGQRVLVPVDKAGTGHEVTQFLYLFENVPVYYRYLPLLAPVLLPVLIRL
jgi:hypothetical protein